MTFDLRLIQISQTLRSGQRAAGSGQPWRIAQATATFGLIVTIPRDIRFRPRVVPLLVGLYIRAASWFWSAGPSCGRQKASVVQTKRNLSAGPRCKDDGSMILNDKGERIG